jgi:hypothetical protein
MQTAQHLRMFEVRLLGPTNTRGARVVVKDTRRVPERRVYLPYSYEVGDILKQAQAWLVNERGIQCLYHASTKDAYYLLSEDFSTEIRDEK